MAGKRDPWKGSTSALILAMLAEEPRHGYAIAREITRRSDSLINLGEGSLYPALLALERSGLIAGEWQTPHSGTGPARKVYSLTDEGRAELVHRSQEVRALAQALERLLPDFLEDCPMLHLRSLNVDATPSDLQGKEAKKLSTMPNVQDTQEAIEPQFEHFLDLFESQLYLLPVNERSQARYEMLSHLQCSAMAFEELGESHETAVASAIERFGKPVWVAHRYSFAWLTTVTREERAASREASAWMLPAAISFVGISVFLFGVLLLNGFSEGTEAKSFFYWYITAMAILWWLCQTAIPVVTGITLSRRYSCRAALIGYLRAVLRVSIPVWFAGKILSDAMCIFVTDSHSWFSISSSPWNDPRYQFAILVRWLVIGLITIGMVSRFKISNKKTDLGLPNRT